MATIPLNEPTVAHSSGPVFFAAGFRPFFLGGAIEAAVMVPLWLMVYGGYDLGLPMMPALWHAHEMVFGFAGAAIGGFLLTAVPNWTNTAHVSGRPLMLVFGAWLAARVAYLACGMLPAVVVAVVRMLYLPILAVLVGRPLVKAGRAKAGRRQWRPPSARRVKKFKTSRRRWLKATVTGSLTTPATSSSTAPSRTSTTA